MEKKDLNRITVGGWSWGAFFLCPLWSAYFRVWYGCALFFVPVVGQMFIPFIMGYCGRNLAWKTGRWETPRELLLADRKLSNIGISAMAGISVLSIFLVVALLVSSKPNVSAVKTIPKSDNSIGVQKYKNARASLDAFIADLYGIAQEQKKLQCKEVGDKAWAQRAKVVDQGDIVAALIDRGVAEKNSIDPYTNMLIQQLNGLLKDYCL